MPYAYSFPFSADRYERKVNYTDQPLSYFDRIGCQVNSKKSNRMSLDNHGFVYHLPNCWMEQEACYSGRVPQVRHQGVQDREELELLSFVEAV